ncbi:hypothetical protein [Actinomycetospora sp. TBRC 11914]|uniref:hypothetical protein n=1 Tax=Actinomycetospora sp. TBRC 11914 TaxID=2729387 RepID=UPI00145CF307|nr:hypothetical protein [Actinomycetospora sp. TBRC 11914]NMO89431.1 hypothetical protein [Actinomycetospora sp. TBRC 11914]
MTIVGRRIGTRAAREGRRVRPVRARDDGRTAAPGPEGPPPGWWWTGGGTAAAPRSLGDDTPVRPRP